MQVESIGAAVGPVAGAPVAHVREMSTHVPAHHLAGSPTPAPAANDVVATLTSQIAAPDLARLTTILQPNRSSEVSAQVTTLTQDTTAALSEGDRTRAITNLNQIAALDPRTIAVLAPEEVLQPIRPEVDYMLNRLTTVAKMDAEGWLAQADQAIETRGSAVLTDWQSKPETVLEVAHRFYDAGGYTNYVRSSDLAQSIVNPSALAYSPFLEQYAAAVATQPSAAPVRPENEELLPKKPTLPDVGRTVAAVRERMMPRLQILWYRAPLLVLLLGWFAAGLIAGPTAILLRGLWPEVVPASLVDFGFDVWGLGFLGLVCFGFYARVRHIRT